jgi:hypothetical protein
MPWVRFEPTIPASERAKTVYALDRLATVTGRCPYTRENIIFLREKKKMHDFHVSQQWN